MENLNTYTAEELQKCPFHSQAANENTDKPRENVNTGDWGEDPDDEAGTDPDRYEEGENDNSGGAGSSGSAATNS